MAVITQPRAAELGYSSLRADKSPGDLVKIQIQEVWAGLTLCVANKLPGKDDTECVDTLRKALSASPGEQLPTATQSVSLLPITLLISRHGALAFPDLSLRVTWALRGGKMGHTVRSVPGNSLQGGWHAA